MVAIISWNKSQVIIVDLVTLVPLKDVNTYVGEFVVVIVEEEVLMVMDFKVYLRRIYFLLFVDCRL